MSDRDEETVLEESITGTVNSFKEDKGFGFICASDPKYDDVFIYWKDIEPWRKGRKYLSPGQKVKFKLVKTQAGIQARELAVERDDIDAAAIGDPNRESDR